MALFLLVIIGLQLQASAEPMALLCLALVLSMSLWADTGPSLVIAILASFSMQPFFSSPGTLYAYGFGTLIAIAAFSATSLVITRLRARVRRSIDDIRALQEKIQLVVDTVPPLIWSTRADGSCDFLSQRWSEYTGLPLQDGLGLGWTTVVHAEDRPRFLDEWRASREGHRRLEAEARLRSADGEHRWFLIRARPQSEGSGSAVKWFVSAVDIEDRRRDEAALRQREAVLSEQASLLDLTHDTVFVRDIHDVITYWNRGAEQLYGWTREEALGKASHELLKTVFPGPLEGIMDTLTSTGRWEGELIHTKRDGSKVVVASRWALQGDAEGRGVALLETNNDVTEGKRAEDDMRKIQAELAHVARVTTMGEMAASIAHEVNQPLSGVVINGNACLRWLAGDSPNLAEARDAVQRIIRDGKRASEVVARIRSLSKKSTAEKEPVDLNEAVAEVMAFAEGELRRTRVALRTDFAPDLPRVMGDRVQLQQVVLNLILNGIEAMSSVEAFPRQLVILTKRQDAERVCVAVRDAGIGLDPENINRIFDAFYTTKRGGMGMGLSISRSIIENHGGRLWAEPNQGPGTTFLFTV